MLNKMSKYTNRLIILTALLLLSLNGLAQPVGTKVIDGIVAQIGEEIILLSDVQNRRLELIQDGQTLDSYSDCLILEEMLFEKLLINQAQIDSV
jgi:peptidyl-prolyl cis-trans isomerase SurA